MLEKTALLNGQSDNGTADADNGPQIPKLTPKLHTMRFTYATGARPLEGFTLKRGIGVGGFGEVYYAVSDAGKEVALKHIQRNLDVELRGVGQCLNLKHPNLLALFDIRYDEAGEGWVVMEYVTGESLADVIRRNPNGMPHDQIAFWLTGIAGGTACLHDHGIVHRDLKPGNVFNDAGIIKVGDYGLSKFISVSRHSAQTESVGTFHYMAPEIGKGRYGREIDVYALGVMLYEMLTGDVPFDGESSQEIIMKHLTAEPALTQIPQPYQAAIARALEKDPDKRLSSIPELLAMLNLAMPSFNSNTPVALTPPTVEQSPHQEPAAEKEAVSSTVHSEPPIDDDIVEAELHEEPDETLYIDDEPAPKPEIEFGPVEHRSNQRPQAYNSAQLHNVPRPAAVRQAARDPEPRPLPKEPIARMIAVAWRGVVNWFENPNISSALKVVVLIAVLGSSIALLVTNPLIVFALMLVGMAYGLYYAIRAIIITTTHDEEAKREETAEATGRARRWHQRAREGFAARPWPQRAAEVTGSLLLSSAIAGVLSVVIMILAGESMAGSYQRWGPQLAWVVLSAVGGSWVILMFAKAWEGRSGDHVLRRIALLAAGLVLGALAYGVHSSLYVDIAFGNVHQADNLWASWHEGNQPSLVAYLAYFGGLFGILRWWLQADPLRNSRLSLWAIILSGFWGFVIPFPQPWGIMLAVAISVSVQLSASWMSTGERGRLRQQFRLQDARA